MEEYENYEEIESEYDSELSGGDIAFCIGLVIVLCAVFAFLMRQLKKSIKNMHVKIGNKIEIGLETKEDKNEIQNDK